MAGDLDMLDDLRGDGINGVARTAPREAKTARKAAGSTA